MSLARSLRTVGVAWLACLAGAASASASSVAYVDHGEVWLASLDGSQKVKLADPAVNAAGEVEPYLDVAEADNGRIVAVRNFPGRISRYSTFRVWEPDGTSTVEGPLSAPPGWSSYAYPLGFDVTADGTFLVYGFSNSSCCPYVFGQGTYVRWAANNGVTDPVAISKTAPALLGNRMVALQDSFSPTRVDVQDVDAGNPFTVAFTPWLDTSGVGLPIHDVDVAATGTLLALAFTNASGASPAVGKIAVITIQGLDQTPTFPAAVDCFLPASGVARDPSLAPDAASIAWRDDDGAKVAGSPTTAADPCTLSRPAVVLSATGQYPSIGGADIRTFLPQPPPAGTSGTPGTGTPGSPATVPTGTTPLPTGTVTSLAKPLTVTLPSRLTAKTVASRAGFVANVRVPRAGTVVVRVTVPAKRLGSHGAPVLMASGKATSKAAGSVRVRVRGNARARRSLRRLRGARATVKATQANKTTTRTVTLR